MCRWHQVLLTSLALMSTTLRTTEGDEPTVQVLPDALVGEWVLESTEIDGQSRRYAPRSVVFADNEYRWYCNGKLSKQAIATVDILQDPCFLDLHHQIGPNRGAISRCIYRFGDNDTLIIAAGMNNGERPLRFESTDATCSSVTVWRRNTD